MHIRPFLFLLTCILFLSCSSSERKNAEPDHSRPARVGFLDAFEDPTIDQARVGFFDALSAAGFSTGRGTLEISYKNAQGNPGILNLATSFLLGQRPDLVATSTTVSTLAFCQKTKTLPVFMLVSPDPRLDGLEGPNKPLQVNLHGVYEDLQYIDTAIALIPAVLPQAKRIAAIYSQNESQSATAFAELQKTCTRLHLQLDALPVNASSETRLVLRRLMQHHPDAFFALPDNSVFASFETIVQVCRQSNVPIFTSEEGLVSRGALAAFGADLHAWGYQAGAQAARFLKSNRKERFLPERVARRISVYNPLIAHEMHLTFPPGFKVAQLSPVSSPGQKKNTSANNLPAAWQNLWVDALLGGLCLSFLAFGIFLSLRIFQIPDITTDGSFTLGAVIAGIMLARHFNPWLALVASFLGGALAGSVTGLIATRLKVNGLLAGILVMTAIYSVNLALLGRANIAIDDHATLFSAWPAGGSSYSTLICLVTLPAAGILFLAGFLKTDFGLALRASGPSAAMARSLGIRTEFMQVAGLSLANGLTAVAGFLLCQFQGFVDVGMGTGIVITGLGSVLIADSVSTLFRLKKGIAQIAAIAMGAVIFQFIIAAALSTGIDPLWVRLITSAIVLMVVLVPGILTSRR